MLDEGKMVIVTGGQERTGKAGEENRLQSSSVGKFLEMSEPASTMMMFKAPVLEL